ncbi:oligopeptide transporter [Aspergillus arachidicola]|uniref:Oligopeptide transporter n=1 Tax=Aspergillus arachidicola TaxID=656916 RepID=A0A2G7FVK0_9EURO|nr:oligopeptide transporter [Aspergillus arachidicola]
MSSGEPTTMTPLPSERTPLISNGSGGAADDGGTTLTITKPNDGVRRIADSLPLSVWLISTIELCERFAYFGTVAPMQNYIQNPRNDPLRPGGIGLGQASATMVNQAFMLWCYITPVLGAVVAEQDLYISRDPDSSIIFNACKAFWIAIKHKGNLDYARPSYQTEQAATRRLPWDDSFIDDLRRAIASCKIFILYPIYWAAYSQFLTNFISQAATMETHGVPNDIMTNIDPITVLILLPVLDRIVFPFLRRQGVPVRHVDRITIGFLVCGVSMLYAAFVQRTIYAAPPCYDHPRAPDCMGGQVPNRVSVFLQSPAYVLVAISEILASVAGVEYAYTQAPKSMKSLIMAVYLSAVSAGALIAITVSPLTVDPKLPWMYFTLGVENFLAGAFLWVFPP